MTLRGPILRTAVVVTSLASLPGVPGVPGVNVRPLRAQSLADVARQEEDRRKALKEPAKVYTNKDLGNVPPAPAPAAPTVPAGSAPPAATPAAPADANKDTAKEAEPAKPDGPVKDQAYWAGRMKQLRTQLDRDQIYADALQTRINSLANDFFARDDPAQRAVIAGDKQKALDELNRLKKAIVDGRKAIADLEEEARRAGVPPGWLRS